MNTAAFFAKIAALWRGFSLGTKIGAIVVVLLAIIGFHFITRAAPAPAVAPQMTHVHLESVAGLSSATGPLPVTGKITSKSKATILSESSGEIVRLYHALGNYVSAGSIIATFENSSQSAGVTQAEGQYEAAQAALAKVSGSSAPNSAIALTQANQGVTNSAASAASALQSAYASMDDAVHTKADTLFSNPDSVVPSLNILINDSQLTINLVNDRSALKDVLADAKSIAAAASSGQDVDAQVNAMSKDAQTVLNFLNDLVKAVNIAQPSQITSATQLATFQTSIGAARTGVVTALSSLSSAKSAYDTAVSGAATAGNSASGGTANDLASAQASVKSAQGALDAAKANLEKTIIRSPISGTIVNLPITQGDFVSQFSQVAQVSNPGALEVDTNVTASDAKTLAVGGAATIAGTVQGVITSIAPALDPTTNKIQVKVGISGSASSLTDGETVTVSLSRSSKPSTKNPASAPAIAIPIVATKITPDGPIVFTVSSSTLSAVPIQIGTILGNQVAVLSGLSPEMDIVTDARGLSSGQTIVVDDE